MASMEKGSYTLIEEAEVDQPMSFKIKFFIALQCLALFLMCFCTYKIMGPLMSIVNAPQTPTVCIPVELTPLPVELTSTLNTTAAQLIDLQDQLSTRMEIHNSIMTTNLDNFTSTLVNITTQTDLAASQLNHLYELLNFGADLGWEDTIASLVTEFQNQARNLIIGEDLIVMVEAVKQIAGTLDTEMRDMDGFMRDLEEKATLLLEKADAIAYSAENNAQDHLSFSGYEGELQHPLHAPSSSSSGAVDEKPLLQWSWDTLIDGEVHPTTGSFTPAQSQLLSTFLHDQNVTPLPTTILYGIGASDTYPTLKSLLHEDVTENVIETVSTDKYGCDVVALFEEVGDGREFVGVQKVECGGIDVVRAGLVIEIV